jgi:hypothetical protein
MMPRDRLDILGETIPAAAVCGLILLIWVVVSKLLR